MKVPLVKEWGSWVVFFCSCLAAVAAGPLMQQHAGRHAFMEIVITIAGLTLLVNSKNSLVSVIRTKGKKKEHVLWLVFFTVTGLILLTPFIIAGTRRFLPFLVLLLSYVILLQRGKEHHLFAELNGFALLTLPAPVVYFMSTGELSLRLYAAVLIFFAAGIFKVRSRIKKTMLYRVVMGLYCGASFAVFYFLDIPVIILIPFVENLLSVLIMREESLKTTGNIELIKGIVFLVLIGFFWNVPG